VAYTDKQIRNGATGAVSDNTSVAQPSTDLTGEIAAAISQAEAAGNDRWNEGRGLLDSPQGSGGSGRQVGGGGSMWEWDAGLAINEASGES
jgi:hypothetical protein